MSEKKGFKDNMQEFIRLYPKPDDLPEPIRTAFAVFTLTSFMVGGILGIVIYFLIGFWFR